MTTIQIDNRLYIFKKEIGQGAYGKAYLGILESNGKYVIIKETPEYVGRSESAILYKIKRNCKKYLICIIDYTIVNNMSYIVLEFIPYSIELFDLISKYRSNLFTKIIIAERLLYGLNVLHKDGIIHRDIKPDNIIIDREMNPHYIDYGVSCSMHPYNKEEKSCLRVYSGTPEYMDPRVVRANFDGWPVNKLVKTLTNGDLFSLGCVFYDLFFAVKGWGIGFAGFVAGNPNPPKYFNRVQVEYALERLEQKCDGTPEELLCPLLYRMITSDVNDRYTLPDLIELFDTIKPTILSMIPENEKKLNVYITEKFGMGNAIARSLRRSSRRSSEKQLRKTY